MLYFDNASTTQISKASLDAYIKASEVFCNPSSLYAPSVEAKNLIETSRQTILTYLGRSNYQAHLKQLSAYHSFP